MMNKGWKVAPWRVRLIFLYWIIPLLALLIAFIYMVLLYASSDIGGMWKIPLAFLQFQLEEMPITTSIDITFMSMTIIGAFYSWRLLKGSGVARAVVEVFLWFFAAISFIYIIFPEFRYFEYPEIPDLSAKIPASWTFYSVIFLCIEIFFLYLIRCRSVKEYTNNF